MAMDIEAVSEIGGTGRFERWLAIVIGCAAVLAALLAILAATANADQERALLMASRLSVRVFEGEAGSSARTSFEYTSKIDAVQLNVDSIGRQMAAINKPETAALENAIAGADQKASDRLLSIVGEMARPPGGNVDPLAVRIAGATNDDLKVVQVEQNRQVDLADTFGERGNRAVLALSLLALGAVLAGLAAVFGSTRQGRLVLAGATIALVVSAAWGATALLV